MSVTASTRITTRLMSIVHKPTLSKDLLLKNRPRYRAEDVLSNPYLTVNTEKSASKNVKSAMPMELLAKVMTEQETDATRRVLRK